jgi:hypothetical protein
MMVLFMPTISLLLLLTIIASSLPSIATSFSFGSCSTTSHSRQCRYRLAKIHHVGSNSHHHRWRSSTSSRSSNIDDGHYQALLPHNNGPSYSSTTLAKQATTTILVAALSLATTTAAASATINDNGADYASTTITQVISQLQSSTNAKSTYSILEEISKIITEGKGIGGTITYNSGIRLGDGVQITDEDTTIYNPGLTLLTASEKDNLVSAMIHNRNIGLSILPPTDGASGVGGWSAENESAFQYIKGLLDPLHMHELSGYLSILPYWGGILYLVAIFVQKNVRDVFPLVYGLCAAGIFVPILILIVSGP